MWISTVQCHIWKVKHNDTCSSCYSALGQTLPPYMIYKGQRLTEELICNGMEGSNFTTSPNGWVTSEIFIDFFRNHFLLHVTERPLILLYDGLDMAISLVEWAQCDSCNGWVYLKYCSPVTKVSDNDTFHCRNCRKH